MNFQYKIKQKQTNKAKKFINKFMEDMRSDSFDGDIHSEENSFNSQKFINKLQSQYLEPIEEIKDDYPEFRIDPFIALIIDKKFKTSTQKQQYLQIRLLERSGAELTMAIYHKQYNWFEQLQVGKIYQFQNPITIKKFHQSFLIEHNHLTNTQEINYNIIDNSLEKTISELKPSENNQKVLENLLCLITQIDIEKECYSISIMDQTRHINMKIKCKDLNKKWENGLIVSQIILIQNVKINKRGQMKWISESSLYNLEQENIFIHQPKISILRNIKLFQQFYLERIRKFNRAYFLEEIFQSIQQLEHNFIAVCKGYFEFEITLQKKWFDYCCICNNKNLQQCEHEKDYVNEYTLTIKTDKTEQSITASMFSNISICDSELVEQDSAKGKYIIDIEKHKEASQNYKYIIRSIVKLNS